MVQASAVANIIMTRIGRQMASSTTAIPLRRFAFVRLNGFENCMVGVSVLNGECGACEIAPIENVGQANPSKHQAIERNIESEDINAGCND